MNLLGVLKRKYDNVLSRSDVGLRERRQLNMVVDTRLADLLKRLAAGFTVPRDILGEHVLETGCYYITRVVESEQKTDMLRKHLINVHLLDNGVDDSEAILRIGEGGNITQLFIQAEPVSRSWKKLQHAMALTKKTGNIDYFNKCEKELLRAAVGLARYIEKHDLDEPQDSDVNDDQQKTNLNNQ